jgi:hypothetical protein
MAKNHKLQAKQAAPETETTVEPVYDEVKMREDLAEYNRIKLEEANFAKQKKEIQVRVRKWATENTAQFGEKKSLKFEEGMLKWVETKYLVGEDGEALTEKAEVNLVGDLVAKEKWEYLNVSLDSKAIIADLKTEEKKWQDWGVFGAETTQRLDIGR